MLTKLTVRNFKTLDDVEIPLGQNVVLIGPNNSGKTTALQALALWQSGVREWIARRGGDSEAAVRTGVTINRKSLSHTPVSNTRLLWHDQRVTAGSKKVLLTVEVEGDSGGSPWFCSLEFYHANSESIYCRPLKTSEGIKIPAAATALKIAMLPPMSGLAAEEPELQPGRISVLLGEGQTAQVLRNLCLQVNAASSEDWERIRSALYRLFGVTIGRPERDPARGTVDLGYTHRKTVLDLASAGRGMQQTLLLLAHMYANKQAVLLLDEPDAHLEILRQRQIYNLLTEVARETNSQIIAASHSEVVLNEAADKHVVVAFVGKPHRIDDRGSQVLKSLREIGYDQYYQAEIKGWVLYLEGATDLAILRGFAKVLGHPSLAVLDDVFVHYIGNQPKLAEQHFHGLREAKPDLVGVTILDRIDRGLSQGFTMPGKTWTRNEIENYLCDREILMRYARGEEPADLIDLAERKRREDAMGTAISKVEQALQVLGKDPWSASTKVSDDFLPPVFKAYYASLGIDDRLAKSDFHILTAFVEHAQVDAEVVGALDLIMHTAEQARPAQ